MALVTIHEMMKQRASFLQSEAVKSTHLWHDHQCLLSENANLASELAMLTKRVSDTSVQLAVLSNKSDHLRLTTEQLDALEQQCAEFSSRISLQEVSIVQLQNEVDTLQSENKRLQREVKQNSAGNSVGISGRRTISALETLINNDIMHKNKDSNAMASIVEPFSTLSSATSSPNKGQNHAGLLTEASLNDTSFHLQAVVDFLRSENDRLSKRLVGIQWNTLMMQNVNDLSHNISSTNHEILSNRPVVTSLWHKHADGLWIAVKAAQIALAKTRVVSLAKNISLKNANNLPWQHLALERLTLATSQRQLLDAFNPTIQAGDKSLPMLGRIRIPRKSTFETNDSVYSVQLTHGQWQNVYAILSI